MKALNRFNLRAWMIVTACACGFLILINAVRIRHLDYLSNAAGLPVATDSASPTGYAGGVRQFIAAGWDTDTYQSIAQTQRMFARGEWRIRHVDYDNVPQGRAVWSASPYRWWLGAIAAVDHAITKQPIGAAVERAALFADPLLQLLLIASTAVFVARRFGAYAAALLSLALALLVPFAAAFVAGQSREDGLAAIAALWSVLPLLIVCAGNDQAWNARRYFFSAGVVGGFGLWLDVGGELPVLAGIIIGGLLAAWVAGRTSEVETLPWRAWAAGGAVACLAAYVIEYLPGETPGWRLDVIHPLHGLAWLGIGELFARANRRLRGLKKPRRKRDLALVALAIIAIAVPLVLAFRDRRELLATDPSLLQLTALVDNAVASNVWTWISRGGFSVLKLATLLPLLLVAPLIWLAARRTTKSKYRIAAMIAFGPVLVTLVIAGFHLRRWIQLDAALLAALVVIVSAIGSTVHGRLMGWIWTGAVVLMLVPGALMLIPSGATASVSEPELESLLERDLAHWLANRAGAGRAAIVASPNLAAALAFEGGLRTLGSPYPENRNGLELSLRISGATSQDEAYALVQRHGITHIVLASWDPALERLAELNGDNDQKSLVALLHRWLPPRWLRPVPYPLPQVSGFEGQSVLVFETVELQDNAIALSRLAEYFVETDRSDLAGRAAAALGRMFPDDLNSQVARVQAASAAGDQEEARDAFKIVETRLATGDARELLWDRRVSLAIVLAEAKRFDQAREQIQQCLNEIDETRLRSLTAVSLFRFQKLIKAFGLTVADKRLEALSRTLLPPEMQSTL